jgi:hypothetical protein
VEYNESLSNDDYVTNFKCCRNCSNWLRDPALMGDYANNTCMFWNESGLLFMTPWAAFCEGYAGSQVNEGPFHKLSLSEDNRLVFA